MAMKFRRLAFFSLSICSLFLFSVFLAFPVTAEPKEGNLKARCNEEISPEICAALKEFIIDTRNACDPAKTDKQIDFETDRIWDRFSSAVKNKKMRPGDCHGVPSELEMAAIGFRGWCRKIAWGARGDYWPNNKEAQANWRAGLAKDHKKLMEFCPANDDDSQSSPRGK
jgi:hypothetical protein